MVVLEVFLWRAGKGKRKGTRQTHPGVLERAGPQCQLPSQGRVLSWPTLGGCGFSSAAYKAPREKGGLFWTGKDKGLTQGRKKSKKFPAGHKNTSFELNLVQFQQAGLLQGLGWGGGRGGMRVWSMTEGRHGLGADRQDALTALPLDGTWGLQQTLGPTGLWVADTQAARERR